MTVPSLPTRFGHRTSPSALILTRVRRVNRCSDDSADDRDEPRAIAELIHWAGDEKRPVLARNPPAHDAIGGRLWAGGQLSCRRATGEAFDHRSPAASRRQ